MFICQVHTHKHSIFHTHDNTDATVDGDTSCSSVRYTHINMICLFICQVLMILMTDATVDGDTSCSSVRYTHINTLSFILMILQTPL